MRPHQNCGQVTTIRGGEWNISLNMGYHAHFYYNAIHNFSNNTIMNVLILQVGWNQREVLFGE